MTPGTAYPGLPAVGSFTVSHLAVFEITSGLDNNAPDIRTKVRVASKMRKLAPFFVMNPHFRQEEIDVLLRMSAHRLTTSLTIWSEKQEPGELRLKAIECSHIPQCTGSEAVRALHHYASPRQGRIGYAPSTIDIRIRTKTFQSTISASQRFSSLCMSWIVSCSHRAQPDHDEDGGDRHSTVRAPCNRTLVLLG